MELATVVFGLCGLCVRAYVCVQAKRAELLARQRINPPSSCKPSAWHDLADYYLSAFRISDKDSACAQFYKVRLLRTQRTHACCQDLTIDPLHEVSPMTALMVTVSNMFVQPLTVLAEGLGEACVAFLRPLPILYRPFVPV